MRVVVAALVSSLVISLGGAGAHVRAAPPVDDDVVAFIVRGVGNGHGRGMSQWGAFGRALAGESWQEILAAYYGGTKPGQRSEPHMRIRLTGWDGAGTVGVVSRVGKARWNTSTKNYTSLYAIETAPNQFSVYGVTSGFGCPGDLALKVPFVDLQVGSLGQSVVQLQQFLTYFGYDPGGVDGQFGPMTEQAVRRFQRDVALTDDGEWRAAEARAAQAMVDAAPGVVDWKQLGTGIAGPIVFSTPVDQSSASPGDVLGICTNSGALGHFRGSIELHHTADGNRVVNDLDTENYLRGVVPKEVPAGWGDAGNGAGMHALRAQAVAARSYGLAQSRYTYAKTCDTTSCQVYAGAAIRVAPTTANSVRVEHVNTDQAIVDTAEVVRVWNGTDDLVSTEFSASNGPRTAGHSFPAVDDPFDDVAGNPNHRWTRIIDADSLTSRYGLSSADSVATRPDTTPLDPPFDGIWGNEVQLGHGKSPVSAWDFRNAFGLPSPGFELIPVRRELTGAGSFAFIGDSVGVGIVDCCGSNLRVLTDGVFSSATFDALGARPTQGGSTDGVHAAKKVPVGTDLVVVELGYNDSPSAMASRIDALMSALRARDVGAVAWVNVSERKTTTDYAATNGAIADAAQRWPEMVVLDWESTSGGVDADRWFFDGIHLTSTGNAEFALWLRDHIIDLAAAGHTAPRPVVPGATLRVPVLDRGGVPASGVVGVALNVTAVGPVGPGWMRVWPCGSDEPATSAVNYSVAGAIEPNAVVVPVDETGEVCISTKAASDVVVDVSAWFDAGLQSASGRLLDTRVKGGRLAAGSVLRVPVLDRGGVPASGVVGVALNVTAVGPVGPGWMRVWPCGSDEPATSAVNYSVAGAIEPNAVVVPVDETGEVCISTKAASDVVVDVSAWFDAGLQSASGRLLDTRVKGGRLAAGSVLRVPVLDRGGVPASGVVGVALNVTAVGPVGPGWMRVWPCGSDEPATSAVNYSVAGAIEPNAVVVPVDETGEVCISTKAASDVVVDVSAWFDEGLRGVPGDRIVDTRTGIGPIPAR